MKRRVWFTVLVVVVLAIVLSAFWVAPAFMRTLDTRAPTAGNSPTITKFQLTIHMFCFPLTIGTEPKNGWVDVFWSFTVVADAGAAAGLTLVTLTIITQTHNPSGGHTGSIGRIHYIARPSPSVTDSGFGSTSFSTHPREGTTFHPHNVAFKLTATDSTGTSTETLTPDLPNCYEN